MYRMNSKKFVINVILLSTICIFTGLYFFTFEHSLSHGIFISDIEKATDATIKDINKAANIKPINKYKDRGFDEDNEDKYTNRKLMYYWIIPTVLITMIMTYILYRISKEFKNDVKNIILNLLVVKIAELYFIFTFTKNFKDQTIDDIRQVIIKKFKEL